MNIAICDDSKVFIEAVHKKIAEYRPESQIEVFDSGESLLASDKNYDLIFLDIEMNGLDGMQTAEMLRKKFEYGYIIFLTSHSEFMAEAFKVKAFRFLTKPIKVNDLEEAIMKAEKEILDHEKIIMSEKGEMKALLKKNILYLEASGDGTYIYAKNEMVESIRPLKYWIEKVGNEHFYQVHKSYAVSMRHVKKIVGANIILQFTDQEIPISRRQLPAFKKDFFEYIKKNAYLRGVL